MLSSCEIWLEGANIPEYLNGTWNNHAPKRKRKLLLHAHPVVLFVLLRHCLLLTQSCTEPQCTYQNLPGLYSVRYVMV